MQSSAGAIYPAMVMKCEEVTAANIGLASNRASFELGTGHRRSPPAQLR